jgi:hypothetical protein
MEDYTRTLAHVEKITAIDPIPGADAIEVASVLGWKCVVGKKDNFKVGDSIVYIEIDSIMPEKPEYEFLRQRKFRVRTIKLRGQVSQGLVLPMSVLPEKKYKEGQDVTELLGVTHYDPESPTHGEPKVPQNKYLRFITKFLFRFWIFRKLLLPLMRKEKGAWPEWFSKTDEERIQGEPSFLRDFKGCVCYVTEKCDGQSATFFYKKSKVNLLKNAIFGVCSRSQWLKTPDDSNWWKSARKYNLEQVLANYYKEMGKELVIQAEQVGPGIQKNKYGLKEVELRVFNIKNITDNYHFDAMEMELFCKENGLQTVPILNTQFILTETVEEMVKLADGKSQLNDKVDREGIVIRYIKEGKKLMSFKAISNTFLLKNEE